MAELRRFFLRLFSFLASIAALLFVVSMVAAYVPIRQALRVAPLVALRGD